MEGEKDSIICGDILGLQFQPCLACHELKVISLTDDTGKMEQLPIQIGMLLKTPPRAFVIFILFQFSIRKMTLNSLIIFKH